MNAHAELSFIREGVQDMIQRRAEEMAAEDFDNMGVDPATWLIEYAVDMFADDCRELMEAAVRFATCVTRDREEMTGPVEKLRREYVDYMQSYTTFQKYLDMARDEVMG